MVSPHFGGRFVFAFIILTLQFAPFAHGEFASAVVSYSSGTLVQPLLNDPASAIGAPQWDTGFGVLTPFNPAFDAAHIVEIGPGGSLVLQLAAPAPTGAGRTIGVHAAAGLIDRDWPNGSAGPLAELFTNPRSATVAVSTDNLSWHSLGQITFDMPTNYFSQGVSTPGYQEPPGTQIADFEQSFVAAVSDFNGRDWTSTLTLLDGSAGGNWLDLSAVPYANANYIRFEVAEGQRMILDAVAVVPEPAFAAAAVIVTTAFRRRRA